MTDNVVKLIIFALAAVLAINILSFCVTFYSDLVYDYTPSESTLLYYVEDEDYIGLRSRIAHFSAEEIAASETLSECYNVAMYYENAVLYAAYAHADDVLADVYAQKCAENAAGMGLLSYNAAIIDALFA